HYATHSINDLTPDRTRILLEVSDAVSDEAFMLGVASSTTFSLPPGQQSTTIDATFPLQVFKSLLGVPQFSLRGVFPRMHTRGKRQVLRADDGSSSSCVVDAPRYSFTWQGFYFFETPVELDSKQTLHLTCSYDTTAETQPVKYGENTDQEMCIMG